MIPQTILFLITANFCLNHEIQSLPLPKTYDGFTIYGSQVLSVESLTLEAFYDLLCPDCDASYPLVMQAIHNQQLNLKQNFTFIVHDFPLPFHRYSFFTAQCEKFLKEKLGDDVLQQYMELIFKNQQNFWNNQEHNITEYGVKQQLAKLITGTFTQLTEQDILNAFDNQTLADQAADSWKYGCTRGVSGTPTYFANGVLINDAFSFDLEDWTEFFSEFYPSSRNQ